MLAIKLLYYATVVVLDSGREVPELLFEYYHFFASVFRSLVLEGDWENFMTAGI
jgi:hypothetical protein